MAALKIHSAKFMVSCGTAEQFLKPTLPEVAIVGRSNVGKSSAINCLVNHKGLAKVDGVPVFQPMPVPTTEQLQAILRRIISRLLKMLTRQGALTEEDTEIPYLAAPDADPALSPLHAAACTYRIALGPRASQKVLTWKDPSLCLANPEVPQSRDCVSAQGFSLHAETSCGPQQRQKLEQLCRYITRPALGHKRLSRTPDPVPRWHHPSRDEPVGIPPTPSGARPTSAAPSHSLPWRAGPQCGPAVPDRTQWSRPSAKTPPMGKASAPLLHHELA